MGCCSPKLNAAVGCSAVHQTQSMPCCYWPPLAWQAVELVRALQSSGLPLSQGEAAQLAAAVRDSHNAVEYRPFVSKLYGKLRVQQAAAGGCLQAAATPDGASTAKGPPAEAAPAVHGGPPTMPQFVAARQRRLQTQVALVLNQQPGALAAEAAEVAALPGAMPPAIPWHRPAAKPFSKRMFERQVGSAGRWAQGLGRRVLTSKPRITLHVLTRAALQPLAPAS